MRLRRLAAALVVTLLPALSVPVACVGVAGASTRTSSTAVGTDGAVGGPELRTRGLVVHPGPSTPPLPRDLPADGWLVADLDTGQVLAAKDPHGAYRPASTLKTLTALALVGHLPLTSQVVPTADDVNVDGTRIGLVAGKSYSADLLLTGMLIASGNDAANALATAAGGRAATLERMRLTARHLQALDTVPMTPSGLDAPGQQTSAYDLALLGRAALADPVIAPRLVQPRAVVTAAGVPAFEISNHNPLLGRYRGTIGVKAGYTSAALGTYVGAAQRGGHRIIITLVHAYPHYAPMATGLLDWGFAARGTVTPVGTLVGPEQVAPAQLARAAAETASVQRPREHHLVRAALAVVLLLVGTVAGLRVRALRRQRRRRAERALRRQAAELRREELARLHHVRPRPAPEPERYTTPTAPAARTSGA